MPVIDQRTNQFSYIARIDLVDLYTPEKKPLVISTIREGFHHYSAHYNELEKRSGELPFTKEKAKYYEENPEVVFEEMQTRFARRKNRLTSRVARNSEKYLHELVELVGNLPPWAQVLLVESDDVFRTRSGWRTCSMDIAINTATLDEMELPEEGRWKYQALIAGAKGAMYAVKAPMELFTRVGVAGYYAPEQKENLYNGKKSGILSFNQKNVPTLVNRIYNIMHAKGCDSIARHEFGHKVDFDYAAEYGLHASSEPAFIAALEDSKLGKNYAKVTRYGKWAALAGLLVLLDHVEEAYQLPLSEIERQAAVTLYLNLRGGLIHAGMKNPILDHISAGYGEKERELESFAEVFRIYSELYADCKGDDAMIKRRMEKFYPSLHKVMVEEIEPKMAALAEKKYQDRRDLHDVSTLQLGR